MIETVQGGSIRVSRDEGKAELECEQSTGEVTYYDLDHQGVTALIKELEEVREKLPKPRVEKTGWIAMFITGCAGPFSTEDEAIAYGKKYPDGFEAAVEVAWGYDVE